MRLCVPFLELPWSVGVADIVESTKAIAAQRYKAVNMAGAAVVASVTNALEGREFPFVFGGDGASFAVAPADLASARVSVATMATDTGSAAADIQSARAELTLAQATFRRQDELMKRGFTTRASYDAAVQAVEAAKAKIAAALSRLEAVG